MNHNEDKPGEGANWDLGVMSGTLNLQLLVESKEGDFEPIEFGDLPDLRIDWSELRYVRYRITKIEEKGT